jgi:redox-sensitive bicupin YhaK (pirin superfamily)
VCTVALLGFSLLLSKPETTSLETMNAATNVATITGQMRPVVKIVKGQKMMEGAGVQICRTIGVNDLRVDPYLMLDELKMPAHEATAGFPDHPHRGFETCSIMLSGKIEHRDSVGNHGVIGPGGVQWMTAGRGIIHSEMPAVTEGDLHGFQLWINLPAKDKMVKPRYQDVQAEEIPVATDQPGSSVRVMAGTSGDVTGPLKLRNPGMLLDVRIEKDGEWKHHVPEDWNGFAYVYHGNGSLSGSAKVAEQHAYIFETDKGKDHIVAKAGEEGLKFLLIAGRPINEPIVQYGPFVMNSPLEIQQAFHDYRTGRLQNPKDNPWVEDDEL